MFYVEVNGRVISVPDSTTYGDLVDDYNAEVVESVDPNALNAALDSLDENNKRISELTDLLIKQRDWLTWHCMLWFHIAFISNLAWLVFFSFAVKYFGDVVAWLND